jgi:putative ABC transport system permease protein
MIAKTLQDIRYALRMLRKNPGFASVVVLTLALGIGANTAIFSVVQAVLLRPLPFHRSDRIVLLWGHDRAQGDARSQASYTDVADYRRQQTVCEEVATFSGWTPLVSGIGEQERIGGALVGDGFFKVLGARAQLGRLFAPEEQEDGKDQVVILSHDLWQVRFGGDNNVVGKTVLLNLRPHTIVGVLTADVRSLPSTLIDKPSQLYRPLAEGVDEKLRSARHLRAIGRLKEGVTLQQAQSELSVIAQRLEAEHPESNSNWGVNLVPLHEDTVRDLRRTLWLLLGAVAFVLLIGCANVANLLLARATMRASEMSIRTALGASRWRLVRQTLTESTLLGLLGGVLGSLLAVWGVGLLKSFGESLLPQLATVEVNLPVLAFTLLLSVLTGIVFGLAPALQGSRPDLIGTLKQSGRSMNVATHHTRLRSAIVTAEIAFALVLLVCAGLLIRSVGRLREVNPGFDYTNVLKMELALPTIKYPTDEKRISFYRQLTERLKDVPGITHAAVVTPLPISQGFDTTGFEVEHQPTEPGQMPQAERYIITPEYLHTLKIPLVRGRELTEQDLESGSLVLLVSEKLAQRFWPNADPVGKRIKLPWNPGRDDEPWRTVVGVVGDVKQYGLDKPASMALYLPHAQYPVPYMTLVVRARNDPEGMIGNVRNAVRSFDPDQAPTDMLTMAQVVAESTQVRRFSMICLGLFAALALTLAAIGIYGVMSYTVTQRRHEIGVRMALGAQRADVIRLVLSSGLMLTAIGVAAGMISAIALTRLMETLLFGVTPTDLTTYAAVCAGLIAVALVSCYIPARRATKVDPLVALRYE